MNHRTHTGFARRAVRIALFSLFLAGSCSHHYYAPNSLNIPALRQAGQGVVRGKIGFATDYLGLEGQAAYSPVRHLAVMANYYHFNATNRFSYSVNTGGKSRGNLLEGGIGAYVPVGVSASASLFGGYGGGRIYNTYSPTVYSDITYRRWFIQPGLTVEGQLVRFGFGLRFSRLHFQSGIYDARVNPDEQLQLQNISEDSPYFLFEPGFEFGLRVRPLVFGVSVANAVATEEFSYKRLNVGLSVSVLLPDLWKKEKRPKKTASKKKE